LKRKPCLPLGIVGSQLTNSVDGELQLKVCGLLAPQRVVIVEDGDARRGGTPRSLDRSVTTSTKWTILCLTAPSFQERSGSRDPPV
jgi:hypothetical protein